MLFHNLLCCSFLLPSPAFYLRLSIRRTRGDVRMSLLGPVREGVQVEEGNGVAGGEEDMVMDMVRMEGSPVY